VSDAASGRGLTRREALCGVAGSCALAALGCGDSGPETPDAGAPDAGPQASTGPGCGVQAGRAEEGWLELRLEDYPVLREVGGAAVVERPEDFLQVVVAHRAPGCFVAVWRICTHGACTVDYRPAAAHFECPCHGSRFGEEGQVLQGPATLPLQTFPVARVGDSLFLQRS
jgi:cytochrome b6-f complex iron-sulfur subunit